MSGIQVQDIKISDIDPNSTVNVRLSGVEENVVTVRESIKRYGYWPEMAIVVRHHPDRGSGYEYEHVSGQCRFKAAAALEMETIPAVVADLDDDAAIQRSWGENEARGAMTLSDKAHWVEKIHKRFEGDGFTSQESLDKAAEFLGVKTTTAMDYYTLVALPDDLKDQVDKRVLSQGAAKTIVKNTYEGRDLEKSQQKMRERAVWFLDLERPDRKAAIKGMQDLPHGASLEELQHFVDGERNKGGRTIQDFEIPEQRYDDFIRWGRDNIASEDPNVIMAAIITQFCAAPANKQ